jgi:hypothetical protein
MAEVEGAAIAAFAAVFSAAPELRPGWPEA